MSLRKTIVDTNEKINLIRAKMIIAGLYQYRISDDYIRYASYGMFYSAAMEADQKGYGDVSRAILKIIRKVHHG